MKLLLDTSVFIKVLENNTNLPKRFHEYIKDKTNEKWISQFSLMELAIKIKIGKLPDIKVNLGKCIETSNC